MTPANGHGADVHHGSTERPYTKENSRMSIKPRALLSGAALLLSSLLMTGSTPQPSMAPYATLSRYLLSAPDVTLLDQISEQFEITHPHGDDFEIIVPAAKAAEFLALAPGARLVEADMDATFRYLEKNDQAWLAGYRSFDAVQAHLTALSETYPELVRLERYGTSDEGRPLLALKISDQPKTGKDAPKLLLTSATHGDELISVEVLLGLVDRLVMGYGSDERLTRMVNESQIYVIPVVNPDGFVRRARYASGNIDPNRDYPWPANERQPRVKSIRELITFFGTHGFQGSIDFHASGRMIMYPWAYTQQPVGSADHERFETLVKDMAVDNQYAAGQISKVIYVAKGSSADYYYWKHQTTAIAVEIGHSKVPPTSDIPRLVDELSETTWRFVEHFFDEAK